MRRSFRCALAGIAVVLIAVPVYAQDDSALIERARSIHEAVITIDTHDDIPGNYATPEMNPCTGTRMQVDVPKMTEGGLDVAFLIVYVGQTPRTPENYERAQQQAMQKFEAIHRLTKELCPDRIELAMTADDVERIHRSGKLVAAIGIENGYVIGRDLSLLEKYHDLGARYMTLAHNGHNDIADSWQPSARSGDEGFEHNGLSAFGEQVVAEGLGMSVDDVKHLEPLPGQILTEEDQRRREKLGNNGDEIDPTVWGQWTSSVENHQATAEEVLGGMPDMPTVAP